MDIRQRLNSSPPPIGFSLIIEFVRYRDAPFAGEDHHRLQAGSVGTRKLVDHGLARESVAEHRHFEPHASPTTFAGITKRLDTPRLRDAKRNNRRPDDAGQLRRGRHEPVVDVLALAAQEFRYAGLDAVQAYAAKRLRIGDDNQFRISASLERQRVEKDLQCLPDLCARSWHRLFCRSVCLVHLVVLKSGCREPH